MQLPKSTWPYFKHVNQTCLGNLGDATFFILGASIKAHLGDLGSATIDRVNYLGMSICH